MITREDETCISYIDIGAEATCLNLRESKIRANITALRETSFYFALLNNITVIKLRREILAGNEKFI
jgi:hypothetical protein